ncbi:MAG TPA: hypothetical protein VFU07_05520 [Candidatus Lumbricidophila sp.]|nr:hypothetical protein [Candidatus Lumbricidophila sp.]
MARRKRYLVPYWLYRWIGDKFVGKFLAYGALREAQIGNTHEAAHIAVAVQLGNSEFCLGRGEECSFDRPVQMLDDLEYPRVLDYPCGQQHEVRTASNDLPA